MKSRAPGNGSYKVQYYIKSMNCYNRTPTFISLFRTEWVSTRSPVYIINGTYTNINKIRNKVLDISLSIIDQWSLILSEETK